ncbi:MAG: putative RND superfamily exporter protein [Mariniblastus sp.]|jgi:predicted RND superfamily exporter protein
MVKRFFSIHVPVFGSVAMVLLCTVFFLLPFSLRGARLGLNDMQNNVADWLPDDYTETKELAEFQKYFYGGDQFVCVSGPWCKEGDPRYKLLLSKLREESLEYEKVLREGNNEEEIAAHKKGDELGLMFAGDYHEDWGRNREKWLKGKNGQWYFLERDGDLFEWDGQNNIVEGAKRFAEKTVNGNNVAHGTFVRRFGAPPDDESGITNSYYESPEKLFCRPFKSVISGPDVFEQMAGPNGSLIVGGFGEDDKSTFDAKIEAHKRLTGALFGPTPVKSFIWTFESLLSSVDESQQKTLRSAPNYKEIFNEFVSSKVSEDFDDDIDKLRNAKSSEQLELWYNLWYQLKLDPPARQTCIVVTLNDTVLKELARAVGRPMLGKSRGRILELATAECGIEPENLRIGGPPSDNVAIDEEGTATLMRLVSLSLIIGLTLAYLSFGSVRVAVMLFFVGGVAAISSLSYVWFAGFTMDAILMSMPSLVYVLALSSAVHIVNYYRDACYEDGPDLAVEKAVQHSWFPCTLAAFTTALGLISLTTSSLTPIYKFGLFSAIATMATVVLLFTYLPSALTVWKPGYQKRHKDDLGKDSNLSAAVGRVWSAIGDWVIGHHGVVTALAVVLMAFFAVGVTKIQTSVHLLKLFDKDAKILHDYRWMEENLGKLVPAEIPIGIDLAAQQEPFQAAALAKIHKRELAKHPEGTTIEEAMKDVTPEYDDEFRMARDLKYSLLERIELSRRVRQQLERHFGPDGMGIVGSGMSMDVFAPLYRMETTDDLMRRSLYSSQLNVSRDEMLKQEYLAEMGQSALKKEDRDADLANPERAGRELWRVSIRLAALNNVDYGQFVNDLKSVVEPILSAHRTRTEILKSLQAKLGAESLETSKVLVLGHDPDSHLDEIRKKVAEGAAMSEIIDQTYIFSDTLKTLLENRGFTDVPKEVNKAYIWWDPEKRRGKEITDAEFKRYVAQFDCVVLIEDDPMFNVDLIKANTEFLVDCRDHQFMVDPETKLPLAGMLTAKEMKAGNSDIKISAMYTGIIPIVYKAQRSLLQSLIESIGLAFVMISFVMMLLLRDWRSPAGPSNMLNIRGGMISMLPNVFPIVIVFGFMGHMNTWYDGTVDSFLVDIGSMMTASVAMGVAVDDTIHFLNWYRSALDQGYRRKEAIKVAYSRVATAMTQTTLIGGLGLSAFALSTFTPTQRFGVLMLFLLAMALVGDLIVLPALLAGPLGKYFGKERPLEEQLDLASEGTPNQPTLRLLGEEETQVATPEVILPPGTDLAKNLRRLE